MNKPEHTCELLETVLLYGCIGYVIGVIIGSVLWAIGF